VPRLRKQWRTSLFPILVLSLLLLLHKVSGDEIEKCLLYGLRFDPPMTRKVTDAEKVLDCQELCLDAEGWGCSYFGYAPDWKGCWLANSSTHSEVNMWTEHFIGGFAECPPDWKNPCDARPNGEIFVKNKADIPKVWPSHFQPGPFQCWPRQEADNQLLECEESTMVEDLMQKWPLRCSELTEVQVETGTKCKENCRASSACSAYQEIYDDHVGGYRCFQGLGRNCWKNETHDVEWGQKVTSAGRFLHGSYRVLRDLRGVYIKNLTQAFPISRYGATEDAVEPALASCKSLCLSKLRCQFWLFSATEGCRYQEADWMAYPWTEDMVEFDSDAAYEVVAGEVIQRTCSKAMPGKTMPTPPPIPNSSATPPLLPTLPPLPAPSTFEPPTIPPLPTAAPVTLPPLTTFAPPTLPPIPPPAAPLTLAPWTTTTTAQAQIQADAPTTAATTAAPKSPVHSAAESIATPAATAIAAEDRFIRAVPGGEMYFEDVKTHSKHLVRDVWACKVCEPTPTGCSKPVDLPVGLVDGLPTSEDFNCEMLSSNYEPIPQSIDGITFTSTSTRTHTTTTTTTTWKFMGDAGGMKYGWLWALLVFLCCGLGALALHHLAGIGRSSRKRRRRDEKQRRQKEAASSSDDDDEEASFSQPKKVFDAGRRHGSSEEGQSLLAPSATSSLMPPTPGSQSAPFLPPTQAAVVASTAGYGGGYGYMQYPQQLQQQGWPSTEMPPTVNWGQPQMSMTSVATGQMMGGAGAMEEYDLVTVLPNGEIQVTPLT